LLQKVIASLGETPVMENSLGAALATLFGTPANNGGGGGGGGTRTPAQELQIALAQMSAAVDASNQALIKQDWTKYGIAQKNLQSALDRALAAQAKLVSPTAKPTPGATPKPGATPSASPSASPSTSPSISPSAGAKVSQLIPAPS
jgi:hypothetical protein